MRPRRAFDARNVAGSAARACESGGNEEVALEHLHLPAGQPPHPPHYTLCSTTAAEPVKHFCEAQARVLAGNACPINYGFSTEEWVVLSKLLCCPSGIWLSIHVSDVSWAAHAEMTPPE